MQLNHEFTVPAPIGEVWSALLDPERVAPCMPGATLSEVDGAKFTGSVKVKLGPVSLLYKGSGEFVETDEAARKVVISASGKDSRGNGTAAAKVTVTLSESGATTTGTVDTDLNITGKPAQFGRGMITEVGGKILSSFSDCLADKLGSGTGTTASEQAGSSAAGSGASGSAANATQPAAAPSTGGSVASGARPATGGDVPPQSAAQRGSGTQPGSGAQSGSRAQPGEPIDLMEYAGGSVAKRAVPAAVAVAALTVLFAVLRRKRKAKRERSASES